MPREQRIDSTAVGDIAQRRPAFALRLAATAAGVWAGVLVAIGAIAAPAAFAVAPESAGRMAARLFAVEAQSSMVAAVTLATLLHAQSRSAGGRRYAETMLALGALFCTVAGYHALQPLMAGARGGASTLSFATLHAAAAGAYALKSLLVLALAWRLVGALAGAGPASRQSS